MTIEDMAIKEMIENLASIGWSFVPDTFEGRKKALEEIAEAAKLEERRRIEAALPKARMCGRADHYDHALEQENFDGFNACLSQVKEIINPKPNLPTNP